MNRLVVVSNRVAVSTDPKSKTGGLAVALEEALRQNGGVWFGWSGKVVGKASPEPTLTRVGPVTFATLDLSRRDHAEYYNGFANRTLWPLFHYRLDLTAFTYQNYAGYLRVNAAFAAKLLQLIRHNDIIWVHDYHLIPLGEELRRAGVDQPMGFFLHTPFPALEVLAVLPHHQSLVRSLCAYDVVGFQSINDLRAFFDYVTLEAGGEVLEDGVVRAFGRTLRAAVFPIGVDAENLEEEARRSAGAPITRQIRASLGNIAMIIGVDRLDYSKGLPERFKAFERFLENYPDRRGSVTLMQIAPPSRSEVPEYNEIRQALEGEAGRINGRFAEFDWVPIHYLNKSFRRNALTGFYQTARIGLVTPLRDGMNLVAKEFVCSQNPQNPGVLVLSRFAGAARELDAALIVNPFDLDGVAEALARGLEMPVEERRERWEAMMEKLRANSLDAWRDNFLAALRAAPYRI